MNIGLVLGAGGAGGWPFHLGVVEAMVTQLAVDPAEVHIVGTSAGAAIGASLKAGATVDRIAASLHEPSSDSDRARMRADMAQNNPSGLRRFRPLSPRLATRALATGRPGLIAAGLLPRGPFPTTHLSRFPGVDSLQSWPARLWIPAVHVESGDVVVFGRDVHDASIADALQASAAVPGMFRPKRIGDASYVDGATASATHADLLADQPPELIIVSSVMTRPGRRASRIIARRTLPREVQRLRARGTRVVTVEPDHATAERMKGFTRRGERGVRPVMELAAALTHRAFDRHGVAPEGR